MNSRDILETTYTVLERLVRQFHRALEGIPDQDLNGWKPAAEQRGGGAMNTLAAMSVHTVEAARWRIDQQVFGYDYPRDRESEFTATATRAEIDQMFEDLLNRFRELIDTEGEIDLMAMPLTPREDHPDRNKMAWLLTTIDHTALHLGHAEITRQLWLAERAGEQ